MVHGCWGAGPDLVADDEPPDCLHQAGDLIRTRILQRRYEQLPRVAACTAEEEQAPPWYRRRYAGGTLALLLGAAVAVGIAVGCIVSLVLARRYASWERMPRIDVAAQSSPMPPATPLFRRDTCETKDEPLSSGQKIIYGILIPVLVILSGIFAGLTLGYMSLDETQLQVLTAQGTQREQEDAAKIIPIRKDGHLLLTTLLIANMITNETLPIIADPLLGGGIQAVIVSIVLVVLFAELIPQSICSRYGLRVGASMAMFTRCVMIVLWPIAYPVSRIMHYALGPHQGVVYRRSELKELVTMHAVTGSHGGDLKGDTVAIVGGALDMQEKVAKEAMTPIDRVHMIPVTARLDYATLEEIVRSGHSRIPVYQDVETSLASSGTWTPLTNPANAVSKLSRTLGLRAEAGVGARAPNAEDGGGSGDPLQRVAPSNAPAPHVRRKILGALLVKQCVLLDPDDAVPVSDLLINALPTVPWDEPLLNVLNVFQEGRSHMAIVSPHSSLDEKPTVPARAHVSLTTDAEASEGGPGTTTPPRHKFLPVASLHRLVHRLRGGRESDFEDPEHPMSASGTLPPAAVQKHNQVPNAPLGIITLEDVLEELIGEEILDEYDSAGDASSTSSQGARGLGVAGRVKPWDSVESWTSEHERVLEDAPQAASPTTLGAETRAP